ncbi:MAG: ribonuclease III [Mariniphaga sp.]
MLRDLRYQIKLFSSPRKEFYTFLKATTGFSPIKLRLYDLAFIHRSASSPDLLGQPINNERLEYLGDAVLGAIVAEYLYNRFPRKDEGFLTQMRSRIVNRSFLTQLTFKLGLNRFINSNTNSVNDSSHIYGDVFEAFIGALYLDTGYQGAKQFVIKKVLNVHVDIEQLERSDNNYKSQLIEWGQKNKRVVDFDTRENRETGHNNLPFISIIRIDGQIVGKGEGYSKKEAQQNSACKALGNPEIGDCV